MLQIITDSASDITAPLARELNIHIVPLKIQFPDGPYYQETDEDIAEFYRRLEQAEDLPVTSQPSPESYLELFEKAKEAGDEVLVLTLSSGLSGTVNAANIAKQMCEYEPIYIVDSEQAIAAQRMLVEYAVKLRAEGVPTPELVEKVTALRGRISVSGVIDTLTYLRKGGRIPPSLAIVGNALRIKPVIALEDKVIKTVGKALGRDAGKKMLYQRFEQCEMDPDFPIYFVYTSDRAIAEEFMAQTLEKYGLQDHPAALTPIGGVIGTHLGTSAVGLCYVKK